MKQFTEKKYDAIVVGSGPNGFTAGITLCRAGLSVLLVEGREVVGGGARTAELTLPGFRHDVCSAIHPMGVISPIFNKIGLDRYGLEWVEAPIPLAHPLPDGTVALLQQSLMDTGATLGVDSEAWRTTMSPFIRPDFFLEILKPVRIPSHPLKMLRFGLIAVRSSASVINSRFKDPQARALFSGCAAHSMLPLDEPGTASFGLVLALAGHIVGWPCARAGSSSIIEALAKCFQSLGGEIVTGMMVRNLSELPPAKAILCDTNPHHLAGIAGTGLTDQFRKRLQRFRYGPGVFKVDWALDGPIPWKNAGCALAATVHVGGTAEEIMRSEYEMGHGIVPEHPFVLVAQQSLFDRSRAPAGKQTGWAYCHVPNGCSVDMTTRIEKQIERFAPGFRDRILARHTLNPSQYEANNPNFAGGDIGGGANDLQQFLFRPLARWDPYSTPNPKLFLCSSSTPPGGGVHGMCGYWAARSALAKRFGIKEDPWARDTLMNENVRNSHETV